MVIAAHVLKVARFIIVNCLGTEFFGKLFLAIVSIVTTHAMRIRETITWRVYLEFLKGFKETWILNWTRQLS
jgi:hypothetical protein